jgi:hypothetical protein
MPEHMIGIGEVRKLYAVRRPSGRVERQTVSRWIRVRGIRTYGGSERARLFNRDDIVQALNEDFPNEPRFLPLAQILEQAKRYRHEPTETSARR